jgi:integrase
MAGAGEGRIFAVDRQIRRYTEDAAKVWRKARLAVLTLHEARHTCASLMIAAGVNAKALSTYMGHATVATTFDKYGHLFDGNEAQAAGLLDAYLAREAGGSAGAHTEGSRC